MSNDNSVPPVNETAEMLHWQIEQTQTTINALTAKIAKTEEQLAEDRRALDGAEAHLRRMETLALIVNGRPPIPAPRDVCEYPDGSIRIGVLVFQHPGPNASEDDLRFFAASMRAIYDVTTPAATHAIQEANAKRHVTAQATVETGAFPAVTPQDGTEVIRAVADDHSFTVGPLTPEAEALWGHARVNSTVTVHWKGGGHITGRVREKYGDRLVIQSTKEDDLGAYYDTVPAEVAHVLPADVDRIECVHCGKALARLPHADWHHATSGLIACHPDGVVSTEATPPADLDQVTATPAATTLPDEAVRTDG